VKRVTNILTVASLLHLALAAWADNDVPLVVKAARVYTLAGEPLTPGIVVASRGRIVAVGNDVEIPAGARVIDAGTGVVTPGLIDACCTIDAEITQAGTSWAYGDPPRGLWQQLGWLARARQQTAAPLDELPPTDETALAPGLDAQVTWSDHAAEVTPHRLVIDAVNPLSNDFQRLLRGGVTTVYVSPDSSNVIGPRGAVLKTGGPLAERVVRAADAVKATIGRDPSARGPGNFLPPIYGPAPTFLTRRPHTRMGVEWVFRKAFHDALRVRRGLPIYGADMPPEAALPILHQVLDGQVPLRIQARMQHDIFTALRLADEFGLKFILEEGTEAYRCLPQLKAAGVPVVFGPLFWSPSGWRRYSNEVDRARLNTAQQLADAGIEFALTAQELRDEDGLVQQALLAMRYGLTREQALRAITVTPARLLGLSDRLGALMPNADADLVVWTGEPLHATSRVRLVVIGGRVVYEE